MLLEEIHISKEIEISQEKIVNEEKLVKQENNDENYFINYDSLINLENRKLLRNISLEFDAVETVLYKSIFRDEERLPKYIELFDLYQSNSEHSRHWFFNGKLELDGKN